MSDLLKVKVRLPTNRPDQGTYVIESVDTEDEGRYYCRAANSLGRVDAYVDVNMLGIHACVDNSNSCVGLLMK